jgi:hypothetical protein
LLAKVADGFVDVDGGRRFAQEQEGHDHPDGQHDERDDADHQPDPTWSLFSRHAKPIL